MKTVQRNSKIAFAAILSMALPFAVLAQPKPAVTIAESGGKTEVTEGGAGDSYTVVLATQPAANVTVTLAVPTAQLQASPTTLTFTTANWSSAQTVNVSAVNDTLDEGLHFATITHAASSSDPEYNGVPVAAVTVTINDNDRAKVTITESGGKTEVTEGSGGDSYTVVLDTQPSANVTITLTVPTAQLQASPTTLTFTPANWSSPQTVNVAAVNDAVDEGLHLATITHTASSPDGNYSGLPVGDVVVAITDNDKAKVTITESGGKTEVTEGGATDSYTVVLDTQPAANVTVTLSVPAAQLLANPTTLTFTPATWNVPQTVNMAAVNDAVDEGLQLATITHATSSSDPNYSGLPVADVVVAITDNDIAKVRITESGGKTEVTEGSGQDNYVVVLDTQPSANVTVTLGLPSSYILASPTTLIFPPANWNVPQTVTVRAMNDGLGQGLHLEPITHAASSADVNYNGSLVSPVVVSVRDNQDAIGRINITHMGAAVQLSFASLANHFYRIEYRTNHWSGSWSLLSNNIGGNGFAMQISDPLSTGNRFFRLGQSPTTWP